MNFTPTGGSAAHESMPSISASMSSTVSTALMTPTAIDMSPEAIARRRRDSRTHSSCSGGFDSQRRASVMAIPSHGKLGSGFESSYLDPGVEPTTAAYNALLGLGVKQRNTTLIGGVYREMDSHNVPMTAETYQYMISAACADDDSTCAMIFFHEMRAKGFKPTTATINELIIVNAERPHVAATLFHELKAAHVVPDNECRPNLDSYLAIIQTTLRAGGKHAFDSAMETYESMKQAGISPSSKMIGLLLSAALVTGRRDALLRAKTMFERDVPLHIRDGNVYEPMMLILGKLGDQDRALVLLEEAHWNASNSPWPNSRVFEAARQACRQHLLSRINVMQRDDSKFRTRHAGKLWIEG